MSHWKARAVVSTIPAAEYAPRLTDALEAFAALAEVLNDHMPRTDDLEHALVPHPDALVEAAQTLVNALKEEQTSRESFEQESQGFENERDDALEKLEEAQKQIESLEKQCARAEEENARLVQAVTDHETARDALRARGAEDQDQIVRLARKGAAARPREASLKEENRKLAVDVLRLQTEKAERGQELAALIVRTESLEAEIAPLRKLRDALRVVLSPMVSALRDS